MTGRYVTDARLQITLFFSVTATVITDRCLNLMIYYHPLTCVKIVFITTNVRLIFFKKIGRGIGPR